MLIFVEDTNIIKCPNIYFLIPVLQKVIRIKVDDGIKDDDLESHICNECIFCEREKVRHHKTRQDEHTFVRKLRYWL